jgi:hypothetical protein
MKFRLESSREMHSSTRSHYSDSEPVKSLLLLHRAACLAEKQQIPILQFLVLPDLARTHDPPHSDTQ